MEQLLGAMKNEKVSSSVFILLLFVAYYAFAWASEEHGQLVTRAEYQRDQQELKVQLEELTSVVKLYIDDSTIISASQLVRDKELQLQIAEATGETETQIAHIKREIEAAKRYRACLIQQEPNCKHLKPPE
jgi:hypothetical protein